MKEIKNAIIQFELAFSKTVPLKVKTHCAERERHRWLGATGDINAPSCCQSVRLVMARDPVPATSTLLNESRTLGTFCGEKVKTCPT